MMTVGHQVLARVQPDITLGLGLQLFFDSHASTWDHTPLREASIDPRPAGDFITRNAGVSA